jgi:hypothetical protein
VQTQTQTDSLVFSLSPPPLPSALAPFTQIETQGERDGGVLEPRVMGEEPNRETKVEGEGEWGVYGVWRVVWSEKLQRNFFFNSERGEGQFDQPDDLRGLEILSRIGGQGVQEEEEEQEGRGSNVEKERTEDPKSPANEGGREDGGDVLCISGSSDEGGAMQGSRERGKEERCRKRRRPLPLPLPPPSHSSQLDDMGDGDYEGVVPCSLCTYHNRRGAVRCDICGGKLQSPEVRLPNFYPPPLSI